MVLLNLPFGASNRVRQLEEELKHLSAVNDAILCASGQSLLVVDQSGTICSLSEGTPKIFGYDQADSLIDQKMDILIQDMNSSLDLSDHTRREARGIHKAGGFVQLEVGFAPIQSTSRSGQTAILVKHVIKLLKRRLSPALRDASSYILDAAFDPMFCTDGDGIIAMVNQAAVNEFGWSREEFIGQNVKMIVGAEHQAKHDSYMQHYIHTGERRMIGKKREIQARRKDGTEFVAELGLAEIPQKDIEEHIFCGFIRNLTKEKAAQAEIIAKQRLTSKIIDASFDALFVINQNGIIQMVNEQSTKVLGWSREEFVGKNISMIMPEEHASNHDGYLARYLKTGIKKMMGTEREVEARCKDGSRFPCLLGLTEVEQDDGGERIFCGFIRSLTKEKAAQAEILAKQRLTTNIIDASFDALFVINERGIIQMVNEQSTKVLGWSREEFIGQNIRMIMPKEHASNHDGYLARYLKTGVKKMMGTEREVEARCKDGSSFPCSLGLTELDQSDVGERMFCGFIRSLAREKSLMRRVSDEEEQNVKNAQEILNQQSTILGILDASFHALFVITEERIIQMVNQKSCDVFGWTREEFIGQNISMIMTDDVAAHHDQYVENYLNTGIKKMIGKQREVLAKRKDGSTFPAALGLAEPQATGLICGFIRDLTQEKAAQAEIIAKQNFTSKIIDASFDALFVINQHGIIQMVNDQSTKALGWSRGEFIGQNISMIMPDKHSANHDGYLARYLETGVKKMMGKEREVEARCKDGSSFPCVLGLTEVELSSGSERIFCGFIRSLAREKKLEKRVSDEAEANIRNAKEILEQKSTILGILDASFHALFVITEERIIQMVNQKSCDVFGWTKEEFIGKNISMIMTDDVAAHHDQYVENYLNTGIKKMIGKQREVLAKRKDGSTFPAALGLAEPQAAGLICGFIRDLTQEKAAQAEIIAKQKFTSKIIDASFDALFVIDQRGTIQMVNEQSTKALGWSREEFIGQNIRMIMPEEHASNHDGYLARYLKTGVKKMMGTEREVEARCKDGSSFPCVLGLTEIEQGDQGEKIFCGFIRSLAREKKLEKRSSELEKRSSQFEEQNLQYAQDILDQKSTILGILDASFHALFVITEERIIQMVNQKSCDVFGWTKEEFIGKNISMIMTDDVAAHHDQYVENYLNTGIKKMIGKQREVLAKRKDGSTFPAALGLAEPQATGLICGFIRDLTQEKAAQAEIIREQLLNSKIIDASFDGLFVIDQKGIIQRVNKASCKVFGWSQDEFIGQNIKMIMPDGHRENHDDYLSHYMKTGFKKMIGKEREIEARRRDGSTFPCILGLSEVCTNGTTQFLGFIRDVTMEKSLLIAQAEREASDSLLFNILPEHIAYRLKEDPSHIADHYDNTTILFADIVGFTDRTSKMSPHDVVSMLNDIFSRFDHLCDVYDLNKVKTIGDCYMITSIPSDSLEHDGCERVCRFALDMLKAVRDFNNAGPQHGPIDFRVGIANGPVVAGVVGMKRFLFDMWGDAVNVAARMEQSGLAGQIQVTQSVVDAAGDDFTFELRGTLAIKGKGPMEVFMLKSAKPSETWRHSLKLSDGRRRKSKQTLRCNSIF